MVVLLKLYLTCQHSCWNVVD